MRTGLLLGIAMAGVAGCDVVFGVGGKTSDAGDADAPGGLDGAVFDAPLVETPDASLPPWTPVVVRNGTDAIDVRDCHRIKYMDTASRPVDLLAFVDVASNDIALAVPSPDQTSWSRTLSIPSSQGARGPRLGTMQANSAPLNLYASGATGEAMAWLFDGTDWTVAASAYTNGELTAPNVGIGAAIALSTIDAKMVASVDGALTALCRDASWETSCPSPVSFTQPLDCTQCAVRSALALEPASQGWPNSILFSTVDGQVYWSQRSGAAYGTPMMSSLAETDRHLDFPSVVDGQLYFTADDGGQRRCFVEDFATAFPDQ